MKPEDKMIGEKVGIIVCLVLLIILISIKY
jgi:hypothetical protein